MSSGVINDAHVKEWKDRVNHSIDTKAWNSQTNGPATTKYNNNLFACFNPLSLCLTTCCCPCITFGKTKHRLRNHGNMDGYEAINTDCLLFCLAGHFGVNWIMQWMQMQDIREKYDIEGSCAKDLLKTCCCGLCSMVQSEKETRERGEMPVVVTEQYDGAREQMVMGHQKQNGAEGQQNTV